MAQKFARFSFKFQANGHQNMGLNRANFCVNRRIWVILIKMSFIVDQYYTYHLQNGRYAPILVFYSNIRHWKNNIHNLMNCQSVFENYS